MYKLILIAVALVSTSCGKAMADPPSSPGALVFKRVVSTTKGSAVAFCPESYQLAGGGCKCDPGERLTAAFPSDTSDAFLCDCSGSLTATATAICLELRP